MDRSDLTVFAIPDFPLVKPGDNLATLILERTTDAGLTFEDQDILVVTQKIVSKAEGRLVRLDTVIPSQQALEVGQATGKDPRLVEVVLSDTREISRMRPGLLIVEHHLGFISANAGVDHSNIDSDDQGEWVAPLPKNPDASAQGLRHALMEATGKEIAVIINDTHNRPWRAGAVGVAIGLAGLDPIQDLRGQPDLFGNLLASSQVSLADQVASAATLVMGQANEGRPVALLRGLTFTVREDASSSDLLRPKDQNLYY